MGSKKNKTHLATILSISQIGEDEWPRYKLCSLGLTTVLMTAAGARDIANQSRDSRPGATRDQQELARRGLERGSPSMAASSMGSPDMHFKMHFKAFSPCARHMQQRQEPS
eukprot:6465211-Amphidinium_carterae.1